MTLLLNFWYCRCIVWNKPKFEVPVFKDLGLDFEIVAYALKNQDNEMTVLMPIYLTWKIYLCLFFFLTDIYFFWNPSFLLTVSTLAAMFACHVNLLKQVTLVLFFCPTFLKANYSKIKVCVFQNWSFVFEVMFLVSNVNNSVLVHFSFTGGNSGSWVFSR